MADFPYLPQTDENRRDMLKRIGVDSIDELIDDAIPKEIQFDAKLPLPDGLSDIEIERIIASLADKNRAAKMKNFIGGGAYEMYVPATVDEIAGRPEFYTAYTPYQPEVSQGTLTAVFEFQSMMATLTGMKVANASMYDGASATAEAAILALHSTKRKRVIYSQGLNPLYLEVLRTYIHSFDVELVPVPSSSGTTDVSALEKLVDENTACVIVQNPNFFGIVEDGKQFADIIHSVGAIYIVAIPDPMSLGIIAPPGDYDADVAVGEAQQFGNYISYGGPYIGFMTAKKELIRSMPGRIIGMTKDVDGKRGFVMVFQTREQHIRRARATSNICTNQQLCALRATVYLALLGAKGFSTLSKLLFDRAHYLAEKLTEISGISLLFDAPFFREFAIKIPGKASDVVETFARKNILPGINVGKFYSAMEDVLLISSSDLYAKDDIDELVESMKKYWNEI
ncbi:aminomethyl-transferring glycine dehydrogenase subunit GcvPA [bacterium]|nr:aminomethyl-transferring glycine dehydrogenase subunit GcvPA [bacterium]